MASEPAKGIVPVLAAVGGNLAVTVMKFAAALMSGSSAMLSEAIHSGADTANQVLLLIGLKRSTKRADDSFEYGYGNERFFWAIISACGIFFIGAGITGYNGLMALVRPHEVAFSAWVFVVLFVSLCIESYTLYLAIRSLRNDFPEYGWRERLAEVDPSTLAVLLEDTVAVFGIVVASVSIIASYLTGTTVWDAIGSIVIAVLLAAVAIILIIRNRAYLIGRSIPEDTEEEILEMLRAEPLVEQVIDFKSVAVGFGQYRIKCEIEFNGSALLREAYQIRSLRGQFEEIGDDFEEFKKFCVEYADRIPRLIGRKVDDIEAKLRARFPSVRHIDIEVN